MQPLRVGPVKKAKECTEMATQQFACDNCGATAEDTHAKGVHTCPECGADMRWIIGGLRNVGDYSLVSESLAINPCQTKAHMKLFPGVKVHPDGKLEFNSFRSHDRYLEQTGFTKNTQKARRKGVRIA